jgi:hypothetical protein
MKTRPAPERTTLALVLERRNNDIDNDDEATDPGSRREIIIRKVFGTEETEGLVRDLMALNEDVAADVLQVLSQRIESNALHVTDDAVELLEDLAQSHGLAELNFRGPKAPPHGFG